MQFTQCPCWVVVVYCICRVGAFSSLVSFPVFWHFAFPPIIKRVLLIFLLFLLLLLIFKLGQCMRRRPILLLCFSFICIFRFGRCCCCCRTSFLTLFLPFQVQLALDSWFLTIWMFYFFATNFGECVSLCEHACVCVFVLCVCLRSYWLPMTT